MVSIPPSRLEEMRRHVEPFSTTQYRKIGQSCGCSGYVYVVLLQMVSKPLRRISGRPSSPCPARDVHGSKSGGQGCWNRHAMKCLKKGLVLPRPFRWPVFIVRLSHHLGHVRSSAEPGVCRDSPTRSDSPTNPLGARRTGRTVSATAHFGAASFLTLNTCGSISQTIHIDMICPYPPNHPICRPNMSISWSGPSSVRRPSWTTFCP